MRVMALGVVAALLLVGACADKSATSDTQTSAATTSATAGSVAPGTVGDFQQNVGDRIFFEFDQYTLSSDARATLTRQAAWLNQYSTYRITVEGHADERGTREYNLALGDRRATSVKSFLVSQGIPASRITTISYGKERPAVVGSNESAWAQNRRGVTVLGN